MGWRFIWSLVVEHDGEPSDRVPTIIRWVAIGLAVVGLAGVLIYRALSG